MPTFHDSAGREWALRFDGLLLADLTAAHGINLADLAGADYFRIERDPSLLTVAVCFLCREQLGKANVTRQQLAAALVGESLDAAMDALWEAARLFFPARRMSVLQSACDQLHFQWDQMGQAMILLSQPGVPPAIGEALRTAILQGMVHSSSSGKSGESQSATGPAASPSSAASDLPAPAECVPRG